MFQFSNYLFGNKDIENKCHIPKVLSFTIDELLEYNNEQKYNLPFNKSYIELKKKIIKNTIKITAFFSEYIEYVQGTNSFNKYNFDYWQYIDTFIFLPKKVNKSISVPPPYYINVAHKNGVKIYGSIYLPDMVKMLVTNNNIAIKLIDLANIIGFDGWYIDYDKKYINKELNDKFNNFCKVFTKSNINLLYYNKYYIINNLSILNINSLYDYDKKLFKKNKLKCKNTYITIDAINLETFNNIKSIIEYNYNLCILNADYICTNKQRINLTCQQLNIKHYDLWSLLHKYIELNSVIGNLPFITNFNTGHGKKYYMNGTIVLDKEWNDLSQQDIMPTWRMHTIRDKHNYVNTDIYYDDAYMGGSSLRFEGLIKSGDNVQVNLYKISLNIRDITVMHIFTKRLVNFIKASMVIYFIDGKTIDLTLSNDVLYNVWTINKFKIMFDNSLINKLSIKFENETKNDMAFTMLLGGFLMFQKTDMVIKNPNNFRITEMDKIKYDNDTNKHYIKDKLNINLKWSKDSNVSYYCIFRCIITDKGNKVEFIARTFNNIYHINNLIRHEDELYSLISIKSIGHDQTVCEGESIIKI